MATIPRRIVNMLYITMAKKTAPHLLRVLGSWTLYGAQSDSLSRQRGITNFLALPAPVSAEVSEGFVGFDISLARGGLQQKTRLLATSSDAIPVQVEMRQRQFRSRIAFRNRCPQELRRGGAVAAAAYSVEVALSDIQICGAIGILRLRARLLLAQNLFC